MNFSKDEIRVDVLFNKMRKTELSSPYYYGIDDESILSKSKETLRKKKIDAAKAIAAIANGTVSTKAKNYKELYFQKMYYSGQAHPDTLH